MKFDPEHYPHPSKRTVVYARRGAVATSQHLAAQAGLQILRRGGNAVDAAVAAAACLTVVEPTSNGIGGDAFAIVWTGGKLHGLNASGPSPKGISIEKLQGLGYRAMPAHGWAPVTVPGAPSAWAALSGRFGRLPLSETLAPAIEYAREGYPVSPVVSLNWKKAYNNYRRLSGEEFRHWFETFAPRGRAPEPGEIWSSQRHAETLEEIAGTKAESFYRGALAEKISTFAARTGGYLTGEDLASYQPEWIEPLKAEYRGHEVWELPPNGHGLVVLLALRILEGLSLEGAGPAEAVHRRIEALKLAFADGLEYITDPKWMKVDPKSLLDESYVSERRRLIGPEALEPFAGSPPKGGTVYLATADGEGNMVSYIQSNYTGFGSGLVVPGTGIALHNRGSSFSLDPAKANCLEPGKRPYHTIIPGFLTKGGEPVGPFGVMGAYMQPQGHLQVLVNALDLGLNPQAALDAPRWQWTGGRNITVEDSFPPDLFEALASRGHRITRSADTASFGRGQIIWRTADGVLAAGTEPRADSAVASW